MHGSMSRPSSVGAVRIINVVPITDAEHVDIFTDRPR